MICKDSIAELLVKKDSRQILSVGPETSVYEAVEQMERAEVGALMVLAGGRLVGVISERDYARRVVLVGRSSRETRVADVMSSPAIFVGPSATVRESLRLMTECRIRHLPVVDEGQLCGMVSIGDLVHALLTQAEPKHFVVGS